MKLCFVLIQFRLLNDLKQDVISIFLFRLTHYFRHYCTLSKSSPPSASSRTMKRKLGVSITSWKTVLNNITYSRWGGSSVILKIENHLEVDDARMAHWLEDSNFVQNRCWAENFLSSANITLRRGVIWDLAQSARKNLKSHEAQPSVISNFSVRFESQISNHTSPQGDVCD